VTELRSRFHLALSVVLVEAVTANAKPVAKSDGAPFIEQLLAADSGATLPVHKSDGAVSGHRASKPRKARGRRLRAAAGKARRVRANTAARIMDVLKAQGGRLEAGSVRKIAKLIGAGKSAVYGARDAARRGCDRKSWQGAGSFVTGCCEFQRIYLLTRT
jgi:hypothetical protein